MRKMLVGSVIAAALATAPAIAASVGSQEVRVGDRVGAVKGAQKAYLPQFTVAAIGFTALIATVWVWDDSRSDRTASP